MENPNYYAVIPAIVRYDNDLKANEKLLYGEITALANKNGYCNANNAYFAGLYKKHKDTISEWISNLSKKDYIKIELIKDKSGKVLERRIYIANICRGIGENAEGYRQKHLGGIGENTEGYRQKHLGGIGENTEYNNTSINNKKEKEEEFKKVINFYENNITLITPSVSEEIDSFIDDGIGSDLIIACMKEAVDRNKRNWKYIKAILNDCCNNNIKTAEQFLIKQKEFKSNTKKSRKPIDTKENVEYKEVVYEDEEEYENKLLGKET